MSIYRTGLVILSALFIISGCSNSSSSGGSSSSSGGSNKSTEFDSTYNLTAESTTEIANDGSYCSDGAQGTMIISESQISGTVVSTEGDTFTLTGTVTESGYVDGGYAYDGDDVVEYSGQFQDGLASGTWEDVYECEGTWSLSSTN